MATSKKLSSRATTKNTGVATRNPVVKRAIPYEGGDTLMDWHKEKMKSSIAETYKNADYATPIWRCETEWDRTKEYIGWVAMWAFLLFTLYSMAVVFERIAP